MRLAVCMYGVGRKGLARAGGHTALCAALIRLGMATLYTSFEGTRQDD